MHMRIYLYSFAKKRNIVTKWCFIVKYQMDNNVTAGVTLVTGCNTYSPFCGRSGAGMTVARERTPPKRTGCGALSTSSR